MDDGLDCTACLALVDDRVDGVLAAADVAAVDAHCRGCAACAAELAATRELKAAAMGLRERAEPVPAALWAAVAARTVAPQRASRAPLAWALAATVIAALAGLLASVIAPTRPVDPAPTMALRPARGAPVPAVAHPDMARRTHLVSDSLGVRRLDAATLAVVERNLAIIHGALADIEAAMAANPNDPNLQRLLAEVHRQESALIERSQRIGIEANRRNDI